MKKLSIVVVALALFFNASALNPLTNGDAASVALANAAGARSLNVENVSKVVNKAFNQQFAGAMHVNWKENQGLYFAVFAMDSKEFTVAYSGAGEMIAISRVLDINLLPLAVTNALAENYSSYKLPATVTEIMLEGDTNYYLLVEGKTRNLQLKCSPDGSISVDKKIKKKILVGSVQ